MTDEFISFMRRYIQDNKLKEVVEIGSDIQLKLALNLAPACETFHSVNFPEDHRMMIGWYEMHQKMGGVYNITLNSGNARDIQSMIPHADLILLRNVIIAPSREDMMTLAKLNHEEISLEDKAIEELRRRFNEAELLAYNAFLKVAKPGYIATFMWSEVEEEFKELVHGKLNVPAGRVTKHSLRYDKEDDTIWPLYIIDNN